MATQQTLPTRTLGNGFVTSAIGLGCMSLTSGMYVSDVTEEQGIAVARRALELGVTYYNTAGFYSAGKNEDLLNKALPEAEAQIGSKWGPVVVGKDLIPDVTPESAVKQLAGSLERLGRDHLDVYILRGPLQPDADLAGIWTALKGEVEAGRVRHLGLSEVRAEDVRAAHAIHPVTLLEYEYSVFSREIEDSILPVAEELGIGITAYSPLGRGILAGRFADGKDALAAGDHRVVGAPRFAPENLKTNAGLAAKLAAIAERKGITAGQLALAWVLAKSPLIVPIPGTKTVKYLEQNVAAVGVQLTPEDVAEIEAAVPRGSAAGDRYSHSFLMFDKA